MPEDIAMDPDFRLGVLPLSPDLEMPFRTRIAFSSAWVRSSISLRSWGFDVHAVKAKTHTGVPSQDPRMGPLALHMRYQGKHLEKVDGGLPGEGSSFLVSDPGGGSTAVVPAGSLQRQSNHRSNSILLPHKP